MNFLNCKVFCKILRTPSPSRNIYRCMSDKTDNKRPFKVIGIQQIAIGAIDKEVNYSINLNLILKNE